MTLEWLYEPKIQTTHIALLNKGMPKQSRGFWACDYCLNKFDRFEEARYHEEEDCPQNLNRPVATTTTTTTSTTSANAYPPHTPISQPPPHQQERPFAASTMAPFSPTEKQSPHHHYHGYEQQQQQQQLPHHHQQSAPTKQPRRFPLIDQPQSHLAEADALVCQNLELFETWGQARDVAQVGLRCLLCARETTGGDSSADSGEGAEYSLPRSIDSLADAVRRIAERHLTQCTKLSVEGRNTIATAIQRRAASEEEGGPSWHEEESERRMLVDCCSTRCRQLGIINKLPENSGIVFQDAMSLQREGQPPVVPQGVASNPTAAAASGFPFGSPMTAGPQYASAARTPPPPPHSSGYGPPGFAGYPTDVSYGIAEDMRSRGAMGIDPNNPPQSNPMFSGASEAAAGFYRNPSYDLPSNFPFFQDPVDGDWMCKYCSHVHPQYRDAHFRWSTATKTPPPGDFIDHHLSICRCYHQGAPLEFHQGPPSPAYPQPQHMGLSPSHQAVWEGTPAGPRGPPASMSPMIPTDLTSPYHPASANLAQQAFGSAQLLEPDGVELSVRRAIEYLASNDRSVVRTDGTPLPIEDLLVRDDDKLLLTDFLFYLMKQLRLVRFSEADRKTRGGKREKIQVGFGGLQCVHCSHVPKSRKFYWSGVDRLANSFAEIPAHVFKCKYCHEDVKDALNKLKKVHPEQMARLPRGSQKVFFRRVWKRLHDGDPPAPIITDELKPPPPSGESESGSQQQGSSPEEKQHSPSAGTSGSDESMFVIERPTKESAKALADSAMQSGPPSPSSRVLLAIAEDKDFLSDTDCFIRKQLEVFCATNDDVRIARDDRKYPIKVGQVGIRCRHCSMSKDGSAASGHAVAFPVSISGIFESVREFQRLHLEYCENLPPMIRSRLLNMRESTTITSIQRKYYALAAKGLGLEDTKDDGIRAGSESVPVVAQAVFAFSEERSSISEEMASLQQVQRTTPLSASSGGYSSPSESRKRSSDREFSDSLDRKKLTPDHRFRDT